MAKYGVEQYRQDLLRAGVGFVKTRADRIDQKKAFKSADSKGLGECMKFALKHGWFEHSGQYEILVLPRQLVGFTQELLGPFKAKPGELFHVWRPRTSSQRPPAEMILRPRVPKSTMAGEDVDTKRVCFCTDLGGCFTALGSVPPESFEVFVNDKAVEYFIPPKVLVPDVASTGEAWSLEPVHVVRCGIASGLRDAVKDMGLETAGFMTRGQLRRARKPLSKIATKTLACGQSRQRRK